MERENILSLLLERHFEEEDAKTKCPSCGKKVLPVEHHTNEHYELDCPKCGEIISED